MVGAHYTPAMRSFMMTEYAKRIHLGTGRSHRWIAQIIAQFTARFPNAPVPNYVTIWRMWQKQNTFFTVHNLCSKVPI